MKAERRYLIQGWKEEQTKAPSTPEFISRVLTRVLVLNRRIGAGGKMFAQLRSPGPNVVQMWSTCLSFGAKWPKKLFI